MTVVLVVLLIICAFGWLIYHIVAHALIMWIAQKGYDPPTDEEVNGCVRSVVREMFGLK